MTSMREYRLSEICDFQGGSQPPKDEWIKEPKEGYIRMLQIRDFTKSRDVAVEYVKCSKKLRYCDNNDILIGRYGASVGKILTGLCGAYNVALIKAIPNETIISKAYIRLVFESPSFQQLLQKVCGQRTAQAGFSKEDIAEFSVIVPPLLEQQRIVNILNAEFAKIDALKENAEKNLQNAKELFQAVLRKELEPKEGWNTASLSELYDVRDGTHDSPKYVSTGYPFVTSKNLKNGEIDMSDVKYISKADFDKINERSKVDKGDVLFAMIGSNLGHPALVVDEPQYAIKNVALFKVPTNMSGLLLTYLLSSDIVMNKVNKEKNGSSQPFVSLKYLRNFIVSVPKTLKEQEELASAIKQQDIRCQTIIDHYYKTCLLCNDLKQALLRKAFNGEL